MVDHSHQVGGRPSARDDCSDKVDGNALKSADISHDALDRSGQPWFPGILHIEEVNVEVVDAIAASEKLKGCTLTKSDSEKAVTVGWNKVQVSSEEGAFLSCRQGDQRLQLCLGDRLMPVGLCHPLLPAV